jgi:hypothetical protein
MIYYSFLSLVGNDLAHFLVLTPSQALRCLSDLCQAACDHSTPRLLLDVVRCEY